MASESRMAGMSKWMRRNKGFSLVEAPAAVIVLTIALLGACILCACVTLASQKPTKAGIVQNAQAEAVDDLKQSGCGMLFEPIAKTMGIGANRIQPTDDKR